MVIRTHIYPFEIALPEVIEDEEYAPKEYLELMKEAIDFHVDIIPCWQAFKGSPKICSDPVLCCPICGFDYMHMPAMALVTNSACIITTKRGTKIIRSKDLFEKMHERGWRLVMFCECEDGHTTKIIFQFHKGNILIYYGKIDRQKFRFITGTEAFEDIDRD
jgi:hypothetical protein